MFASTTRYAAEVVVHLPFGPRLACDPRRTMGFALCTNGTHELSAAEMAFRLAEGQTCAVDVGANLGYMSVVMGTALARSGTCHAFEPVPELFRALSDNCGGRLNPDLEGKIRVHEVAVSDRCGTSTIFVPLDDNEGLASLAAQAGSSQFAVTTETLDSHYNVLGIVSVIKIDVEGHELAVLQGAERLLAEGRIGNVIFEDHHWPQSPVFELLRRRGFDLFLIGHTSFRPRLTPFAEVEHVDPHSAPNWLASRSPEASIAKAKRFGWRVLGV